MNLVVATLFWQPNRHSYAFSRYDESWVDKLYRGFKRNLTRPFDFIAFTDREYGFEEPEIQQRRLLDQEPDYSACIEPYSLDRAMILVGLDTIVTGNCDRYADWIEDACVIGVPRDPFNSRQCCNGVALVPEGLRSRMWDEYDGRNDMDWIRANPHVILDEIFPGEIVSYKGSVKNHGLGDARIVYFHGHEKPHELDEDWIREHWR